MARQGTNIRFPLAAAMLAAMGSASGAAVRGSSGDANSRDESACGIIARGDLPAPAFNAIVREAGGLDFGPVILVEREGTCVYQADMLRDGHATGVEVGADGTVTSVTTEVEAWELPPAVKRAVDAETLGFPARSFTVVTRGEETLYLVDAATERRGKQLEIDPQGRVLSKVLKIG